MSKIDGGEVVLSTSIVLGTGQQEARIDWPKGVLIIRFLADDQGALAVTPSMEGDAVLFSIVDGNQQLSYAYDGNFDEDGLPTYRVVVSVTPIGSGAKRPRTLIVTIVRIRA